MAMFESRVRVEAPVDRVFEVFSNVREAPKHIKGITALEVLTDGPIGTGTRFRESRVMFGKTATETMEFTEFQPGRAYTVGCTSCGVEYATRFTFTPTGGAGSPGGSGGTDVVMTTTARPVTLMAKIMSPLMGLMMKGAMKKMLEGDLNAMKAAAERGS